MNYTPDRHLAFAPPVVLNQRNIRTIARIRPALEAIRSAKNFAKGQKS